MDARTGEMLLDLMAPVILGMGLSGQKQRPEIREWEEGSLRGYLKKHMAKAQKRYINGHEAYKVLDTEWFSGYLRQFAPVRDIFGYVMDGELWKRTSGIYVRELAAGTREYAAARVGGISDSEEMALRNFYRMLLKTARDAIEPLLEGYLLPCMGQPPSGAGYGALFGEDAYQEALTDKKKYLSLAEELLGLGGRKDWTRREFRSYPWEILAKRPELKSVAWDFYLNMDEKSIREWMVCLAGEQWEHYASFYISYRLKRSREERVPEHIEAWIRQYYGRHIEGADIKGAIQWKTDSSMLVRGWMAEPLALFAERFGYDMPKEKAKELLFLCAYPGTRGQRGQKKWLPRRYLKEEEIREQIIANMTTEDLKGDVMRWHIRYCTDTRMKECANVIQKAARNPTRNLWVRKDALAYVCSMTDIQAVCREILPGLKGELFFFVAESFQDTENTNLADLIWDYGDKHPAQKLRCDICLTAMQDPRGLESLRRHLRRRNRMPPEPDLSRLDRAVRRVCRADLADEFERFQHRGR